MKILPSLAFKYLTNLEENSFYNCPKIFCFTENDLPSLLLELYIQECPQLCSAETTMQEKIKAFTG
jgi:hypothetical protein